MSSDRQSLPATLAFRFATVYFTLYALCTLSSRWAGLGWDLLASWVGTHVLGIDSISFWPTVSGDTTADYVLVFTFVVLAVLGCVGWTAFDRGRTTHPRLAAWLTVAARYWLGLLMVSYGVIKVFPLQFPAPDLVRLGDTYGDSSPLGLMTTFMGHSPVYTAFAGGTEVLGGVLLFWRRTTTLGALICIGVMAHVVVLGSRDTADHDDLEGPSDSVGNQEPALGRPDRLECLVGPPGAGADSCSALRGLRRRQPRDRGRSLALARR